MAGGAISASSVLAAQSVRVTVNPTQVNFGAIPVGSEASKVVSVTNESSADLAVTQDEFRTPDDISPGFGTCPSVVVVVLTPGMSCTVEVHFNPSEFFAGENQVGTLAVFVSDPSTGAVLDKVVVTVRGKGLSRAGPGTVLATISVGDTPAWLAIDQRTGDVYVANIFSDDVSVIDGQTNLVVATIPLAGGNECAHPFGVGYDKRTDIVYVSCQQYVKVTAIDGKTRSVVGEPIEVGSSPFGVALNERNGNVYIAVAHPDWVAVLDGATHQVIHTIQLGTSSMPFGIAYDGQNGDLYVANSQIADVTVIDGRTDAVKTTITMPSPSLGIAYARPTNTVFVANYYANAVSVIDGRTNQVTATISMGAFPIGVAFNERDGNIYVADSSGVKVIDVSTNTVVRTIPLAGGAVGVAAHPMTGNIYATNGRGNSVTVISPAR